MLLRHGSRPRSLRARPKIEPSPVPASAASGGSEDERSEFFRCSNRGGGMLLRPKGAVNMLPSRFEQTSRTPAQRRAASRTVSASSNRGGGIRPRPGSAPAVRRFKTSARHRPPCTRRVTRSSPQSSASPSHRSRPRPRRRRSGGRGSSVSASVSPPTTSRSRGSTELTSDYYCEGHSVTPQGSRCPDSHVSSCKLHR